MSILNFFKEQKSKKELNRIADKVENYQQAKDFVNKAMSYRNIKDFDKALKILEKVLKEYPNYKAANLVYGVTLRLSREVDKALSFFNELLLMDNGSGVYNPKEIYANIGVIYLFDKDQPDKALDYYRLALKAPNCPNIDEKGNNIIISNIHRDIAYVFFVLRKYENSISFAEKRLNVQNKCPMSSKIFGLSKINVFIDGQLDMDYFADAIKNTEIVDAIEKLNVAYEENDKDYAVINGLTLGYYLLSQMPYYNTDEKTNEYLDRMHTKFFNFLEVDSKVNNVANYYFDMYNNLQMNIAVQVLKYLHPGLSFEFDPPQSE